MIIHMSEKSKMTDCEIRKKLLVFGYSISEIFRGDCEPWDIMAFYDGLLVTCEIKKLLVETIDR